MKQLPFGLILFRLALAPLLLFLAYLGPNYSIFIVVGCYLALISDIFDGIIARHYQVATPSLRLWDSNVDLIFWLCACWCIWMSFPKEIEQRWSIVLPLLLLEWIPDIIYWLRFRKFGCAHNYLSKLFGIFLLLNFTLLFGFSSTLLLTTTILLGLVSQTDRILIALILPARSCDIPSAYHARLIKKGVPFKKYKLFHS
ncbi:MAG: CDP-alcohol phosphatidyltransferase family protein [Flavobacteriales bacterium]